MVSPGDTVSPRQPWLGVCVNTSTMETIKEGGFYANTHTHTHMYKTQIHRDTDACQHNNLFSLKKGGSC